LGRIDIDLLLDQRANGVSFRMHRGIRNPDVDASRRTKRQSRKKRAHAQSETDEFSHNG
jgi:hypothetical protein